MDTGEQEFTCHIRSSTDTLVYIAQRHTTPERIQLACIM